MDAHIIFSDLRHIFIRKGQVERGAGQGPDFQHVACAEIGHVYNLADFFVRLVDNVQPDQVGDVKFPSSGSGNASRSR